MLCGLIISDYVLCRTFWKRPQPSRGGGGQDLCAHFAIVGLGITKDHQFSGRHITKDNRIIEVRMTLCMNGIAWYHRLWSYQKLFFLWEFGNELSKTDKTKNHITQLKTENAPWRRSYLTSPTAVRQLKQHLLVRLCSKAIGVNCNGGF